MTELDAQATATDDPSAAATPEPTPTTEDPEAERPTDSAGPPEIVPEPDSRGRDRGAAPGRRSRGRPGRSRRRRRAWRARARGAGRAPNATEPSPAARRPGRGPQTVGRFIADALRAAGVRIAFTVPGESFLGVLDALRGCRDPRRRDAPRGRRRVHGRGLRAADRPAGGLPRARGPSEASNLAIGIHTARQDSTPMFALVGQVQRDVPRSRGVPGGRPGRDARWPRQVGRRADDRARRSRRS